MSCNFYYFDAVSNAAPSAAWIFKDVVELQSWNTAFFWPMRNLSPTHLGCWLLFCTSSLPNQSNRHHYTQYESYLFKVLNMIIAFIQLVLCSSKGTIHARGTTRAFAPMWWADTCWKVQWKDIPSGRRYSSGLSILWLGFVWWFPKFKTGGKLQPHWPLRGDSYKRYPVKEIDININSFFNNPSTKLLGTKSRQPLNTWCSNPWVSYMIWDKGRSWYRTCFCLGIYRESFSAIVVLIYSMKLGCKQQQQKHPLLFFYAKFGEIKLTTSF